MDAPLFWLMGLGSLMGTAWCWRRVYLSRDLLFFKVVGILIAAIPFAGPFLFLLLDMPPRLPKDAQATADGKTGTPLSQVTGELYMGRCRYLRSLYQGHGRRREVDC